MGYRRIFFLDFGDNQDYILLGLGVWLRAGTAILCM